jgi:hypothetical protein
MRCGCSRKCKACAGSKEFWGTQLCSSRWGFQAQMAAMQRPLLCPSFSSYYEVICIAVPIFFLPCAIVTKGLHHFHLNFARFSCH